MTYVVELINEDGSITYAGKDSWESTNEPTAVFSLRSAKGKASWWRTQSCEPNMTTVHLNAINIKPVLILVDNEVAVSVSM